MSGIHELHYPPPLKRDSNQSAASAAFSQGRESSDRAQPRTRQAICFFFVFVSEPAAVELKRCYCSVNQYSVKDWAGQLNNEQPKVAVKPKEAADMGGINVCRFTATSNPHHILVYTSSDFCVHVVRCVLLAYLLGSVRLEQCRAHIFLSNLTLALLVTEKK